MISGRVLRRGGLSVRYRPRTVVGCGALALVIVLLLVAAVTTGDFPISAGAAIATVLGGGDGASTFIVTNLRLPRALTAVGVGAALGASSALLQRVSRNALASPDLIGFTTGAATGAIAALILGTGSAAGTAAGAVVGGVATAASVYLLAYRRGVHGMRLILVGIGTSAALYSVNAYLISRAPLHDALAAQAWLVGGLNNRGWAHARLVALALLVLLPAASALSRRLAVLDLGDATGQALGLPVERTRGWSIAVSVALAAVATAAAGPIAFLALAAPQLARRLVGSGPVPAALLGAALLLASDVITQRLFAPTPLPVGVVTAGLGGGYLIWLLITGPRR